MGGGRDKHTHTQTHRHINTMTRPGLRDGPSEKNMKAPMLQGNMAGRIIPIFNDNPENVDEQVLSMMIQSQCVTTGRKC